MFAGEDSLQGQKRVGIFACLYRCPLLLLHGLLLLWLSRRFGDVDGIHGTLLSGTMPEARRLLPTLPATLKDREFLNILICQPQLLYKDRVSLCGVMEDKFDRLGRPAGTCSSVS